MGAEVKQKGTRRLTAWGKGGGRGWDGWMASPTPWTWVWASSGRWWRTGKPGVLQSMGSQSQTRTEQPQPQCKKEFGLEVMKPFGQVSCLEGQDILTSWQKVSRDQSNLPSSQKVIPRERTIWTIFQQGKSHLFLWERLEGVGREQDWLWGRPSHGNV